ncbi:MAG TPA: hypothetical protein PK668_03745 [Myxococcota bacterium]|nr:hypothetical protein [Myxococcota bacterium]HRY91970.1 hypothetical protein [Myxococcota bacterium]HSA21384.1 hypothetical protein [Myxococcota bacterium]
MRATPAACLCALTLACALAPAPARAHWCTNIYDTPARLVVKPEQSTIFPGDAGTLRVWVRNNFPYLVKNAELRASNADFDVSVSPARQDIFPGQDVAFDLRISRSGSSGDDDLHLQLRVFEDTDHGSSMKEWRGPDDEWIDQAPAEALLRDRLASASQAVQLNAAKLADRVSEGEGVGLLVELYGRPRLQYNSDGAYGDGEWFGERALSVMDYQLLRAGTELAIRRASDPRALEAMRLAMDDPDVVYRGASALLAAYLARVSGQAEAVRARLTSLAEADACGDAGRCAHYGWTPSPAAQAMGRAALFVLGEDGQRAAVEAGLQDADDGVKMICAAALGLRGEDAPVQTALIPLVKDEYGTIELYAPYLLQLVATDRRGPDGQGQVSFYPEHGPSDPSGEPGGCATGGAPGAAAGLALLGLLLGRWLRSARRG